jgi:leucyl/phenylalanyl-tRNA--protein transferase
LAAVELTPAVILRAYSIGIFPMARSRDDPSIHWVAPTVRGILPLDTFHAPRRLRRALRRRILTVTVDQDFASVIAACAEPRPGHEETWINEEIRRAFCELNKRRYAHSVETWRDGRLVGGLYGLAIGGAFFGESMFSRVTDASKIALTYLVGLLRDSGFTLLDVQFVTEHLRQFGAIEIPAANYLDLLDAALTIDAAFPYRPSTEWLDSVAEAVVVQSRTQTS